MRTIVITAFITLDGVVEAPQEWSGAFQSPDTQSYNRDVLFAADTLLLGRVTYEGFASAWPGRTDEEGFAERMNTMEKVVVSRTLEHAGWSHSTMARDDVRDVVGELKHRPGRDILVWGSPTLVRSLIEHDLVDRYELLLCPVVAGAGAKLFTGIDTRRSLRRGTVTPLDGGMTAISLSADRV